MSRPLAAVLNAFGSGACSLAEIESATALDHDVVTAAVDHLVRASRRSNDDDPRPGAPTHRRRAVRRR